MTTPSAPGYVILTHSLEREASAPWGGTYTTLLDEYHTALCAGAPEPTHTPLIDTKHLSVEHCTVSEQPSAQAYFERVYKWFIQVHLETITTQNSAADNWIYQGNLSKGNTRTQIGTSQLLWGFEGGNFEGSHQWWLGNIICCYKISFPCPMNDLLTTWKPNSVDRIYSEAFLTISKPSNLTNLPMENWVTDMRCSWGVEV